MMWPKVRTLYRRKAHIIVWNEEWEVTHPCWPLYWSPTDETTYVAVREVGGTRLWLPIQALLGHWDWFCGRIDGYRVYGGYEGGIPRPAVVECGVSWRCDPDTRVPYLVSERMPDYSPDAHV